jgi:hypothetical protein
MVFTREENMKMTFENLIKELKCYYGMNGSNYKMVGFFSNQHIKLRKKATHFNMINIADKYLDTINDLIYKIGGEEE